MSFIDWVIVTLYCSVLIAVAWIFHRRAGRSVDSYFVADRKLPWWIIGLSDTAAYTGGGQAFLMVFFLGGFGGFWLMGWVTWVIWMPLGRRRVGENVASLGSGHHGRVHRAPLWRPPRAHIS